MVVEAPVWALPGPGRAWSARHEDVFAVVVHSYAIFVAAIMLFVLLTVVQMRKWRQ